MVFEQAESHFLIIEAEKSKDSLVAFFDCMKLNVKDFLFWMWAGFSMLHFRGLKIRNFKGKVTVAV